MGKIYKNCEKVAINVKNLQKNGENLQKLERFDINVEKFLPKIGKI